MEVVDFSLVGNYLNENDNLESLEKILKDNDPFMVRCVNSAMLTLFSRISDALEINEETYKKLSNINKFYLVRGAFPDREREIRAFILERFYKFTS